MKNYDIIPHFIIRNTPPHTYPLLQLEYDEIHKLIKENPIKAYPIYFAFKDKNPDGSECEIPLYITYPVLYEDSDLGNLISKDK